MPIYEYECNACGDRHEFIQKFSESPKRKCPSCGKPKLKKLVSAAAFHLKGDGWYVTDFRDKGKKKTNGEDKKGTEAKDTKADDAKSDTKDSKDSKDTKETKPTKSKSSATKSDSAD